MKYERLLPDTNHSSYSIAKSPRLDLAFNQILYKRNRITTINYQNPMTVKAMITGKEIFELAHRTYARASRRNNGFTSLLISLRHLHDTIAGKHKVKKDPERSFI